MSLRRADIAGSGDSLPASRSARAATDGADIADQFGVGIKHLLHIGGDEADVDHFWAAGGPAHQERRFFHGVVADGDDQIGAVDGVMDVIAFRECRGAEIEVRAAGHRALAHLGVEEGNAGAAHEVGQRVDEARPVAGGADHDQRTFCFQDHRCGSIQRGGRGHRPVDRMRGQQRGVGLFGGDVLGQFEMHRPRPLLHRDAEGIAHHRGDRGGGYDLPRHLGQRAHRADDIDDLEARLPRALDRLLAGEHQHRHGAEMGIGRCRGEIQRAGSKRRQANAGLTGQAAVGRRHEGRRLLVPRQHEFDPGMAQRFQDVEVFLPRQREDAVDTFVFQCRDQ